MRPGPQLVQKRCSMEGTRRGEFFPGRSPDTSIGGSQNVDPRT